MTMQHCIYTIEELRQRLAFWQQRLRLQDWDIEVKLASMGEMGGDFSGEIWTFPLKKRATVLILRETDYEDSMSRGRMTQPHDMEYTLLHELMHLSIYQCSVKFEKNSREEMLEEQAVHALALGYLSFVRPAIPVGSIAGLLMQGPGVPLPLDLAPPRPHLVASNAPDPVAYDQPLIPPAGE